MKRSLSRYTTRPTSLRSYLITLVIATATSLALTYSRPVAIAVDGQRIVSDVAPVTAGRGTFLPLRAIGLAIGAVTSFDTKTGRIEILRGRDTVLLHLGQRRAFINGEPFTLVHAPFAVRGRVMVPSSLFEHVLHAAVRYDGGTGTIDLVSPRSSELP